MTSRFHKYLLTTLAAAAVGAFSFAILLSPTILISLIPTEQWAQVKRDWIRSRFSHLPTRTCRVVFVFGDSTLATSFYPKPFDDANGGNTCSFNLAIAGHSITKARHILHDAVTAGNIPDIVLVNFSSPMGRFFLNGNYDEFLELFPDKSRLHFWFKQVAGSPSLLRLFRAISTLADLPNSAAMRRELSDQRGVYWWSSTRSASVGDGFVDANDRPRQQFPSPTWDTTYRNDVVNFIRDVDQLGAELYLIEAPLRKGSFAQRSCLPLEYRSFMTQPQIVRFLPNDLLIQFLPSRLFFDRGHVNEEGAAIYSQMLGYQFSTIKSADERRLPYCK